MNAVFSWKLTSFAISSGIFGFPKNRALGIIFSAAQNYSIELKDLSIQVVRLVLFDEATIRPFLEV